MTVLIDPKPRVTLDRMAWKDAIRTRLSERFNLRHLLTCELCSGRDWAIGDGFVTLNAFRRCDPDITREDGISGLWFVVFQCSGCGNAKFLNAKNLGLDHLVEDVQPVPPGGQDVGT